MRTLLDDQIPVCTTTFCCSSNAWFNDECWKAKQWLCVQERVILDNCHTWLNQPAWLGKMKDVAIFTSFGVRNQLAGQVVSNQSVVTPASPVAVIYDLLGCSRTPPADIDAATLHQFFDEKVDSVRAAMSGSAPPVFTQVTAGSSESSHRLQKLRSLGWWSHYQISSPP